MADFRFTKLEEVLPNSDKYSPDTTIEVRYQYGETFYIQLDETWVDFDEEFMDEDDLTEFDDDYLLTCKITSDEDSYFESRGTSTTSLKEALEDALYELQQELDWREEQHEKRAAYYGD